MYDKMKNFVVKDMYQFDLLISFCIKLSIPMLNIKFQKVRRVITFNSWLLKVFTLKIRVTITPIINSTSFQMYRCKWPNSN